MTQLFTPGKAERTWNASKSKILKLANQICENVQDSRRSQVQPSPITYEALRRDGKPVRFQLTADLLDREFDRRSAAVEVGSDQVDAIGEGVTDSAIQVPDSGDKVLQVKYAALEKHAKWLEEGWQSTKQQLDTLNVTLRELAMEPRMDKMLQAVELGLPVPKENVNGEIVYEILKPSQQKKAPSKRRSKQGDADQSKNEETHRKNESTLEGQQPEDAPSENVRAKTQPVATGAKSKKWGSCGRGVVAFNPRRMCIN